jgi:hypothetical protein
MTNRTDSENLKRLTIANSHWRMVVGDAHSTGEYFADVATGNTKQLVLNNDSSDQYYGMTGITVRSSGTVRIGKAFNPTVDTAGSAPTHDITNKRSGGNGTTGSAATGGDNETGAYSGGTRFNDKGTGSGQGSGNAQPGETTGRFPNIVDPGDSILIEATNETDATMAYISIDMDWVEIPADDFP